MTFDKYHVDLVNPTASEATSVSLFLPGQWVQGAETFRETSNYFNFLGSDLADTFFVTPDTGFVFLPGAFEDTNTLLSGSLGPVTGFAVPAGETRTVAVLSVLTGESVDLSGFGGNIELGGGGGTTQPLSFRVPEPATASLAALGAVASLGGRRGRQQARSRSTSSPRSMVSLDAA